MGHMTNGTDILSGLSWNNFGGEWSNCVHVKVGKSLLSEMALLSKSFDLGVDDQFATFFEFLIHF